MPDIRELRLENTIQYSITQYRHTQTVQMSENYKMLDIADMNQNLSEVEKYLNLDKRTKLPGENIRQFSYEKINK